MQLFVQAQAAKDEAELKRVAEELRATITEHFRVPEHSLASKASMIVARDSAGD
jgi:hemerythrin